MAAERIVPIIMCGGAGTRLWPASRETMPKHLMPMVEGRSTFEETLARVSDRTIFAAPVIITAADTRFIVGEQMARAGVQGEIILEPSRRDSAAAVAVGALMAARSGGGKAVAAVFAADHLISPASDFVAACAAAAKAAAKGFVMTLGVRPASPATGYGYIRQGMAIAGTEAVTVDAFVEKPDEEKARGYIAEGYLWNSGNFLFPADLMLEELAAHAPATLKAATDALDRARRDLDFIRLDQEAFETAPKISIDYAVMEKTNKAGVLPVSFSWSDIGAWDAMWDIAAKDAEGNVLKGPAFAEDTRNSYVQTDDRVVAVVGLDDIVVVNVEDAVLVAHRNKAGRVKELVGQLRQAGRKEADEHQRVYRPWGWYQRIDIGPRFQVKRIQVKPGGILSLQKHFHRAEHWVVVRGTAEVTVDDTVSIVPENESIYLPLGCVHRMANPGKIPLEIIEVQVGSYTGEDDIIRIEDRYGR
jgi:mannose-1-phosphate guanylyltransferase / mannose-6-phosphate isomerase